MMTTATDDNVVDIPSPGDPASPLNSTGDPESPPSPPLMEHMDQEPMVSALSAEYSPEDKVHSCNQPDSNITTVLNAQSKHLWNQFDSLGTEMIVTRRGRRMFPPLKIELFDLNPTLHYVLLMDMAPVDKYRYKYQNSAWVKCFEEECSPTRLYVHPDSPALGSHWMNTIINFYKLKLTNNQLDRQGHIIVNSMHRYQPRLHVVESSDINNLSWENFHTFIFPGTQFTTVTAYQNDKITQLKIENNPFAKGFRSPFSRCRTRNQHHSYSFPLRSNSDSGPEEQLRSPPNIFHPHFLLPPSDHNGCLTGAMKRRLDSENEDVISQKRICLVASERGSLKFPTSQTIPTSQPTILAPAIQQASAQGNGAPVFIIYKPAIQPTQPLRSSSPPAVRPGLNGTTLLQTTNGQIFNGATIFQAQPIAAADAHVMNGIMTSSQSSPAAVLPHSPKLNGAIVRDTSQPQPTLLNGATVVQGSPTLINGTTILQANRQSPSTVQKIPHPQATILSVPQTHSTALAAPFSTSVPMTVHSKGQTPTVQVIDISTLTKEANHSHKSPPPPLLQVSPVGGGGVSKEKPPTPQFHAKEQLQVVQANSTHQTSVINGTIVGQTVMLHGSGNGVQKYFVVAEKPDSSMLVLSAAQQHDAGNLRTQILPASYDQQVVTTMPIYRFNSLNTLQPIQILTTVAAPNSITTA